MRTAAAVLAALMALCALAHASETTRMKVLQVVPGEGIIATYDKLNSKQVIVEQLGKIFIACDPKGAHDGQVVSPAPAIFDTGESYSYTTVLGAPATLRKFSFTRK